MTAIAVAEWPEGNDSRASLSAPWSVLVHGVPAALKVTLPLDEGGWHVERKVGRG